jgi:hypothetical protein
LFDRIYQIRVGGVRTLFRFPNPVNETSARLVAGGVVVQAVAFLVLRQGWLLAPLTYGFIARVATGPTLSPLGQLVTRVITPRLPMQHRFVAGPPKRFAQGVGVLFSGAAATAWLAGAPALAFALIGGLIVAATLESVFAFCLGCVVFGWLMRLGVVPAAVCRECGDIRARLVAATAASA